MKENDWILANINNPDFSVKDFKMANLDASNTQLLSSDEYKKSQTIIDAFTDESGKFDETAFDTFYKQKQEEFLELNTDSNLNKLDYSIWDTRSVGHDVKNPEFRFIDIPNRHRQSIGIEARNTISDPELSDRELAQQSKIWDSEKQQYIDETPNDRALFSDPLAYIENLFGDPLVLATYDNNVTDDKGNIIHRKGETKLNEEGLPYYETLNGRSIIGKDVLSSLDIVTKEGTLVNKYDFFDADSLDKSAAGVIVKNVAAVAPLFFLGPVGATIYGGYFVARELAKAAPMAYEILTMLGDSHEDAAFLNTMAAYGHKLSGSTSDYARNNMFSFENFGNLISDVALQWQQQMAVAKAINKLQGNKTELLEQAMAKATDDYANQVRRTIQNVQSGKMSAKDAMEYMGTSSKVGLDDLLKSGQWQQTPLGKAAINNHMKVAQDALEKQAKLGRNISLAYMSIISNTDLYQDLVEKGASKSQAAAMALGSIIGMYGVNKLTGIGEAMFDASDAITRRGIKDFISKNTNKMVQSLTKTAKDPNELLKTIKKGSKFGEELTKYQRALQDHTLTGGQKILTEAIEETSEEIITDISRQLGEIAHNFGYVDTGELGAWDNALSRYTMSFLGGAIGGGVFYGKEVWNNRGKTSDKVDEQTLIWAARNNKIHLFEEAVDKMTKRGEHGSSDLSYDYETGTIVSADSKHKSINEQIGNELKSALQSFKTIVEENQLNVTDDQLYDRMVLSDVRLKRLQDYIGNGAFLTDFHQRFQDLTKDVIELDQKLNALTDEDRSRGKDATLIKRKQEKIKERDSILNGEYSRDYTDMMLFALDSRLSSPYVSTDIVSYVKNNHNQNYNRLTESEQKTYDKEYADYVKTKQKEDVKKAFEIYLEDRKQLSNKLPTLNQIQLQQWESVVKQLENLDWNSLDVNYDTQLENETPEEYALRNTIKEGETTEQFIKRKTDRENQITQLGNQKIQQFYQDVINKVGILDPNTYRILVGQIEFNQKTRLNDLLNNVLKPFSINKKLQDEVKNLVTKAESSEDIQGLYEDILNLYYQYRLDISNVSYHPQNNLGFVTLGEDPDVDDDVFTPQSEIDLKTLLNYLENTKNDLEKSIKESRGEDVDIPIDQLLPNLSIDRSQEAGVIKAWNAYKESELSLEDFIQEVKNEDSELYGQVINGLLNKDTALNKIKESLQNKEDFIKFQEDFKQVLNAYFTDPWNNIFNELKRKLNVDANPILNLLSIIGESTLEKEVQEIFENYANMDDTSDFELTDNQLQSLEKAAKLLDKYQALIYGASTQASFVAPIGHNKTLNEFVKNHPEAGNNWEPLLEIKDSVANVFNYSIDNYKKEINLWRNKHEANRVNKIKEQVLTEQALIKTRLDFINSNKEAFKLKDLDLLEGVTIEDNDFKSLIQANVQIRKNFLKSGKTITQVLDEVIPKLIKTDAVGKQILSGVKKDLSYEKLTDYDKFILFTSLLASNNAKFIQKTIDNADDKIVSLAAQEYSQYILNVIEEDVDMVNEALSYIKENYITKDIPVLWNTAILTGGGGAGKTKAVLAKQLRSYKEEDLIISGPTDQQIDNLQEIFKKANKYTIDNLIQEILGSSVKSAIDKTIQDGSKSDYLFRVIGKEGSPLKLKEDIVLHDIKNAKAVVIDEATKINNVYLQVLANWAKKFGKKIYLAGDENQNSYFNHKSEIGSIDRELVLAWRAPRINLTLRDTNVQKVRNIKPLDDAISQLRNSTEGKSEANAYINAIKELTEYNLNYYLKDGQLFGEYITDELKPEQISLLKGTVAFIGDPESKNYKTLVDSGLEVTVLNPDQVQGREYTYTVVDIDWNTYKPDKDWVTQNDSIKLMEFMQQLYTMITRSMEGTILINNGLTDLIRGNKENQSTGRAKPILAAREAFEQRKKQQVESLGDLKELINETFEKPKEKPKKEKPKKEKDDEEDDEDDGGASPEPFSLSHPIRVYSNVSLLGVKTEQDDKINVWINEDDSRQDIGIFLRKGQRITNPDEKDKLVTNLIHLKSLFEFGDDFFFYDKGKVSNDVTALFTKEALQQARFFIKVGDEDQLVGLSDLEQDQLNIGGKVITLIAKINDVNGIENTVTLGGLANPATWKANYTNIVNRINSRMSKVSEEEKIQLTEYIGKLKGNMDSYENFINKIKETNQEIEIEKPDFTGMTDLVTKHPDGSDVMLRLEEIDSTHSPFDSANKYVVKSPLYVGTATTDKLNEIKPGRGQMFVTRNPFLSSDELITIYEQQKTDPKNNKPWVRALPLENLGVSFESLYSSNYKEIYNIVRGSGTITFPAHLETLGARMYISLWNHRADLLQFKDALNQWKDKKGISDEEVQALIEEDYKEYVKALNAKRDSEPDENKKKHITLSEKEFRSAYKGSTLQKLWEFNDSLANTVRMFRLGYGAENGIYNRYLTNITADNQFYKDYSETPVGMYLQPDVMQQHLDIINYWFDNIITKFIPNISEQPKTWIDRKEMPEQWTTTLRSKSVLNLTLEDPDSTESHKINHEIKKGTDAVAALPLVFVKMFKKYQAYRNLKSLNKINMKTFPNTIEHDGEILKFLDVENILPGGILDPIEVDKHSKPIYQGVKIEKQKNGTYKQIDRRLENLINFIFHGFVSQKEFNNFTGDELRATLAYFKNGIYSDPILMYKAPTAIDDKYAYIATSRKLFAAKALVGGTIININFKPKEVPVKPDVKNSESSEEDIQKTNQELIDNLASQTGITKDKQMEFLTTREEIIVKFKSEVKKVLPEQLKSITSTIDGDIINNQQKIAQLSNIVTEIEVDEANNIKVVKLSDLLENSIVKVEVNNNQTITITDTLDNKFNIKLKESGEVEVLELGVKSGTGTDEKSEPISYNIEYAQTLVQEALQQLQKEDPDNDINTDYNEYKDDVDTFIKSLFEVGESYTYDVFNKKIGSIKNYLNSEYEWSDLANRIKTIDCK